MKFSKLRVTKALKHRNVLGAGAAARRKHLRHPREFTNAVMKEFNRGTLHSGSGYIVESRGQALAIGMSEARRNVPRRYWTVAMKRWEKR